MDAIPTEGLTVEERITADMLRVVCQLTIVQDDERIDRLKVVDQLEGPQQLLSILTQFQAADTPERLDRFLARLRAYPAFMAANRELLREGLATGLTAPRIVTDRTIAQVERILSIPPEESFIVTAARVASDAARERVLQVVRDEVYPADAEFLAALKGEYREASRVQPGLWSAPNGDKLYRTQILAWTTLELDPQDVHRIGLEELEQIEQERRQIAREEGFDDTNAYRAHLLADPANVPTSREALLARAREDIERAMAVAPRYFGRQPVSTCAVRAVEEFKEADAPFAYYYPPSADGSRGGTYYVNTFDLKSRAYTKLATTTYHEAVPGHHFQIALEMEHPDLPVFRRLGSRMVGGAYVEGWGLYAERLADEMGLFRNGRAVRDARRDGLAGGPAGRRQRHPRPALVASEGRRPDARGRAVDDRRDHRDGSLHLLARPGPDLQDRPARDPAVASRSGSPGRLAIRPAGLPRPGPRPRLAAAGHAGPGSCRRGWPHRPRVMRERAPGPGS